MRDKVSFRDTRNFETSVAQKLWLDNDRDRVAICDVRYIFNDIKVATIPLLHIQNINFGQFVEMNFYENPF